MNKIVKKAMEMHEFESLQSLPDLEVGDIVTLGQVWDGNGETPTEDYSYKLNDIEDWINYTFEVIEEKENVLDTIVKITNIDLI